MRKLICLAVACCTAFALSAQAPVGAVLKTTTDTLSYAIGINMGQFIKSLGEDMDYDVISSAIKDFMIGEQLMDEDESYEFLEDYFSVRKPAQNRAESDAFIASMEKQPGVKKTESGLLYQIVDPGSNEKVVDDEEVVQVVYTGYLPDGTVFDSTDEDGPAEFALYQVIDGWAEGVKLIGKGGKIKLWINYDLGYGEESVGNLKPYQALIFEVELLDILPPREYDDDDLGVAVEAAE